MTIKQLLAEQKALISQITDENTKHLASHDYRVWLAESLGKTPTFLIAHDDYQLTENELAHYQQGLAKLLAGVPLGYVTGHQPFWQGDFLVNEHTLIPRADTEILVETVLAFIDNHIEIPLEGHRQNSLSNPNIIDCYNSKPTPTQTLLTEQNLPQTLPTPTPKKTYTLLDMGTGSGCIVISLAMSLKKQHPTKQQWQFSAVDISKTALIIAEQNALRHQVDVTLIQGDWFCAFNSMSQKFDIIVSNPPYIDPQDPHLTALSDEPITALVSDNQGLADIFTLIETAKFYLEKGGLLAIEHGYDQAQAVQNRFIEQGFSQVATHKDRGGHDRVTFGVWDASL